MRKYPLIPMILCMLAFSMTYASGQEQKQEQRRIQSRELPPLDLTRPGNLQVPRRSPQRDQSPNSLGLKLGFFLPTAEEGFEGVDEDDFNDIFFGGELNLGIAPTLYFTASLGYYKGETTPPPAVSPSDIELTLVPILFSLKYVFPGTMARPYFGGGLGWYDWEVDKIAVPGSSIPLLDPAINDGTEFGFHFLGGFVAPISPVVAFMGEAQFHVVTADTDVGDLDLGGLNFNFGFLFFF